MIPNEFMISIWILNKSGNVSLDDLRTVKELLYCTVFRYILYMHCYKPPQKLSHAWTYESKWKVSYSAYNKSVLPTLASQIHQYQISRENVSWLQHINHQSQLHTLSWFRLAVTHAIQGHMCFSIYTTLYVCTLSLILQCFLCIYIFLFIFIYNNMLHWTSIYPFIGYNVYRFRIAGVVVNLGYVIEHNKAEILL